MIRSFTRHPATATAVTCVLFMTGLFWVTGTLWPTELPHYARSSRQITGMALMLIVMPTYLLIVSFVTTRRSLDLVDQLRSQLSEARYADEARQGIMTAARRTWPVGLMGGLAMGWLNTDLIYSLTESSVPGIDLSISFGQLLLWSLIGTLLAQRIVVARVFSRLGEVVNFDLFRLDRLRPLARSGFIDVLVIAGVMALTPLQSLDAEFHFYNYRFALMVGIPAMTFLGLWPLRSVHTRISAKKQSELARVEALVSEADRGTTSEGISRFELLLAYRERLRDARTWPLTTALISRFIVYLVIPPLAWSAAAVVEAFVSRMIEG